MKALFILAIALLPIILAYSVPKSEVVSQTSSSNCCNADGSTFHYGPADGQLYYFGPAFFGMDTAVKTFTHTNMEANPWWKVTLQNSHLISSVTIYHRIDCGSFCAGRMRSGQLTVWNAAGTQVYQSGILYPGGAEVMTFPGINVVGKTVQLQLLTTTYLEIYDVDIQATATPAPPTPTPHTQDPAVAAFCDHITTKCADLAAECTTLHSGIGAVIGEGDLPSGASAGQQTGGVTLTGNTVIVTASGTAGCGGTAGVTCPSSPSGTLPLHLDGSAISTSCYFGSLLARVGAGPWQCVGAGPTAITGTGALIFAYNDSIYYDNWGTWHIKVHASIAGLAADCDASVTACNHVHADCVDKAAHCPVV